MEHIELRLSRLRIHAPKMHSRLWREVYIPTYEWLLEWRDHGREVIARQASTSELPPR